jgi:uncharacterized protein YjiS (DUF1127 family)
MNAILDHVAARWQRFTCRLQEARRARRALRELQQMDAQGLRDIGISHAALATTARIASCCA